MKATFRIISLIALVAICPAEARKRYDERGNPITGDAAELQAGAEKQKPPGTPVREAAASPTEPALPEVTSATTEPDTAEEESQKQQLRHPLTKVYLENAQLYLRSDGTDKALEFLRRSQEAGEDSYSREARLQAYWLRARRGDSGLAAEAENLDEGAKLAALLRAADGYYACSRELQKKTDCLAESERVYAMLAELAPGSAEGKLAALRLAQLLLDQGRLEAALPHLTRLLTEEPKTSSRNPAVPFDRAWYTLGNLYERPWYHRDTHKARLAYQQVLKYSGSPYHSQAKERIRWLERFGTGAAGTGRRE